MNNRGRAAQPAISTRITRARAILSGGLFSFSIISSLPIAGRKLAVYLFSTKGGLHQIAEQPYEVPSFFLALAYATAILSLLFIAIAYRFKPAPGIFSAIAATIISLIVLFLSRS